MKRREYNIYLEQPQNKEFFTRGESVSVKCEDRGFEERVHFFGLDEIHALGQISGLSLQEIEHFLVELRIRKRKKELTRKCNYCYGLYLELPRVFL